MTKQQKIILSIFMFFDLLVISGLVYVVWTGSQPAALSVYTPTQCDIAIREALAPRYMTTLAFPVNNNKDGYLILFETNSRQTNPTDEQHLWSILDELAIPLSGQCSNINKLLIQVNTGDSLAYTFIVQIDDIKAWVNQDLDDQMFAERIKFRRSSSIR